jgi:hypothetical protein
LVKQKGAGAPNEVRLVMTNEYEREAQAELNIVEQCLAIVKEFEEGISDRLNYALEIGRGLPWLPGMVSRVRKGKADKDRAAASASITMPAPGAVEAETAEGLLSPDRVSPRGAKQADAPVEPVGAHGDALADAPPPKAAAKVVDRREQMRAEWQAQKQAAAERAEAAKRAEAPPFCDPAQPGAEGAVRETYRWRPGPAGWDDVVVPKGLSQVERLTYVWGPVAEIVDWISWGAPKASRSMALSVALGVVGILEAWRYEGPTESGTHLFQVTLVKTAAGKDHPRKCGINLMQAVAPELLGPTKFASGGGLEMDLAAQPVMLCFVDEMGDQIKGTSKNSDLRGFVRV